MLIAILELCNKQKKRYLVNHSKILQWSFHVLKHFYENLRKTIFEFLYKQLAYSIMVTITGTELCYPSSNPE